MMDGLTPTINGDGSTSRDFTFVGNAVQANLLACTAPREVATGRVFNVGTGHSQTLNDLYAAVAEILHFRQPAQYGPTRAGDVQHSLASIERASSQLGYKPQTDFRIGLEKTIAWYLEEKAKETAKAKTEEPVIA